MDQYIQLFRSFSDGSATLVVEFFSNCNLVRLEDRGKELVEELKMFLAGRFTLIPNSSLRDVPGAGFYNHWGFLDIGFFSGWGGVAFVHLSAMEIAKSSLVNALREFIEKNNFTARRTSESHLSIVFPAL